MIKSYFQTALRILRKQKVYSFISIAGLALGMACCFVVLVFLRNETSYDAFHHDADSIFRLVRKMQDIHGPSTRNPMGPALEENFPEIELAVRTWLLTDPYSFRVEEKGYQQESILFADPGFFRLFTYEFLHGDPNNPLENPSSIVLTQSTSQKYFGVDNPVGRTLSFDGKFDLVVSAVIRDVPQNSHLQFQVVIPLERFNAVAGYIYGFDASTYRLTDAWMAGMFGTYLKLQKGADPQSLERKFPDFLKKYAPYNKELLDESYYLQPIKDIHLHSQYRSGSDKISDIKFMYGILAIGLVILAMSCFNYINLTTARFSARRREIGIRKVVGAHRKQLIGQILTESSVFFLTAFFLSFVLILLLTPVVNHIFGYAISSDYFGKYSLLLLMFLIGLLAALLSGFYPALFFSAFHPMGMIKDSASSKGRGRGIRSGFVIFQFSITISLLIGTGLIYQQVRYLKGKDLGYVKEQILVVPLKDDEVRERHETIKQELIRLPGISGVSFSAALPNKIQRSTTLDLDIEGERKVLEMTNTTIDEDFLSLYEMDILQGRNFSREFPSDAEDSIILNESAVRTLGWQNPIGRELTIFGRPRTVIGVVKDFHFQTLHLEISPLALRLKGDEYLYASIRLSTRNISQTLAGIGNIFQKLAPQTPFEYYFFDDYFENLYRSEESFGQTIGYFTLLAILISSLGLFGLAYFITEQRTKEIGIRKVLGASVPWIVGMLSKEFATWALLANVLAWPVAYLVMRKWLQNFAYRIPIGIGTFVLAGAVALLIALLTVSFQSVRAATSHPADTLRYE
jgi:putative ABC transport system permease protein